MERLCKQEGIQTVTLGVLGRAKSHSPRLRMRISVPIRGGFQVIAHHGKTVQEVFIVTILEREQLENAIVIAMGE